MQVASECMFVLHLMTCACLHQTLSVSIHLQVVPMLEGPKQPLLQWTAALESHRLHDGQTKHLQ